MDEIPPCETGNHQNPGEEHRLQPLDISHSNFLHDTKARKTNKQTNELVGLHQDKKLLRSQGNSQKN